MTPAKNYLRSATKAKLKSNSTSTLGLRLRFFWNFPSDFHSFKSTSTQVHLSSLFLWIRPKMDQSVERVCIMASETTIHDVCDDMLREIFAHFDLKDLEVMVDVCSTFRKIAQTELASRFKKVRLVSSAKYTLQVGHVCGVADGTVNVGSSYYMSFFRKFGNGVHTLNAYPQDAPIKAIAKYCRESLRDVYFGRVKWTNKLVLRYQPILSQLRVLHWDIYSVKSEETLHKMISSCQQLKSLTIENAYKIEFRSPVALPQLKKLKLSLSDLDTVAVKCLIMLNPQLEEITLPCAPSSICEMIDLVSTYVPNVEKLKFGDSGKIIVDWRKFKNLKFLDMGLNSMQVIPILKSVAAAAISLERLCIATYGHTHGSGSAQTTEFIEAISIFKRLKGLYLTAYPRYTLHNVLTIVRNLPDLIELFMRDNNAFIAGIPEIIKCGPKLQSIHYRVRSPFEPLLDLDTFLKIRDAVLNHSEHRPLRLHFEGAVPYFSWNISKKVAQANDSILILETSWNQTNIIGANINAETESINVCCQRRAIVLFKNSGIKINKNERRIEQFHSNSNTVFPVFPFPFQYSM